MQRPKWLNREVFGWAMFDFANQSFTLVIITTLFSRYFVYDIVGGHPGLDEGDGRQLWALAGIISLAIVILLSPLIGALADFSGAKKKFLFLTYVVSFTLTAALGLVPPGAVAAGMILFIVAYTFYAAGENFMSAFLPELAGHREVGRVSAFGFTLGYFGGLLCLGGAALITYVVEGAAGYRLVCLWAGVFFALAGVPTFLFLRERKLREEMPAGQTIYTVGFHRIAQTFRSIRQFKYLFRFLAIMTFYMAGMKIIVWFAGVIGSELFGLSDQQLAVFILVLTVTAIAGAFVTGRVQDRIGTKLTILLSLGLWLVVMVAAAFIESDRTYLFWLLGSGVGFGMGSLGTSTRAMFSLFTPQHKTAEFFGFYGLGNNLAGILGLVLSIFADELFGEGNYALVVASSAVFFLGGIIMMVTVDEKTGRVAALRSAREHVRRHHDYVGRIGEEVTR